MTPCVFATWAHASAQSVAVRSSGVDNPEGGSRGLYQVCMVIPCGFAHPYCTLWICTVLCCLIFDKRIQKKRGLGLFPKCLQFAVPAVPGVSVQNIEKSQAWCWDHFFILWRDWLPCDLFLKKRLFAQTSSLIVLLFSKTAMPGIISFSWFPPFPSFSWTLLLASQPNWS